MKMYLFVHKNLIWDWNFHWPHTGVVRMHYFIFWGRGDRGFWLCDIASSVMYCNNASLRNRIVTKSLTAPPYSILKACSAVNYETSAFLDTQRKINIQRLLSWLETMVIIIPLEMLNCKDEHKKFSGHQRTHKVLNRSPLVMRFRVNLKQQSMKRNVSLKYDSVLCKAVNRGDKRTRRLRGEF